MTGMPRARLVRGLVPILALLLLVSGAPRVLADEPGTVAPNADFLDLDIRPRVVGGKLARENSWPWQVLIVYSANGMEGLCGGSILTPGWILTAAHCVVNEKGQVQNASGFRVVSGTADLDRPGKVSRVRRVVQHPRYGATTPGFHNDIALLELVEPAHGQPVTLAAETGEARSLTASGRFVVTGFGTTSEGGNISKRLLEVSVPPVPRETCNRTYGGLLREGQICAGGEAGRDSCQGDSGGPLHALTADGKVVQVGVVSFGKGCARPGVPGVYTDVAAYRSWIRGFTGSVQEATPAAAAAPAPAARVAVQLQPGPSPRLGELVRMAVTSSIDGYVLLVDIDPSGQLNKLLPNSLTTGAAPYAAIRAGQTIVIPPAGASYQFRVTGATGPGTLVAIVAESVEQFRRLDEATRISVERAGSPSEEGHRLVERWLRALGNGQGRWGEGRQEYTVRP